MCLEVSMLSGSYFLRGPLRFVGMCQWGALKMWVLQRYHLDFGGERDGWLCQEPVSAAESLLCLAPSELAQEVWE